MDAVPCRLLRNSSANGKFNAFSKAAHNYSELVKAMNGQSTGHGATSKSSETAVIFDHLSQKKETVDIQRQE